MTYTYLNSTHPGPLCLTYTYLNSTHPVPLCFTYYVYVPELHASRAPVYYVLRIRT